MWEWPAAKIDITQVLAIDKYQFLFRLWTMKLLWMNQIKETATHTED